MKGIFVCKIAGAPHILSDSPFSRWLTCFLTFLWKEYKKIMLRQCPQFLWKWNRMCTQIHKYWLGGLITHSWIQKHICWAYFQLQQIFAVFSSTQSLRQKVSKAPSAGWQLPAHWNPKEICPLYVFLCVHQSLLVQWKASKACLLIQSHKYVRKLAHSLFLHSHGLVFLVL